MKPAPSKDAVKGAGKPTSISSPPTPSPADAAGAPGADASAARKRLNPVVAESGRPLYLSVRDSLRHAIDQGIFKPGEQMPSTKELSEQMAVSLVTAHRALQELVTAGVLQRSQGKGTFIHDRYPDRMHQISQCRVGLVMHKGSSIADYYHGQVLEGIRRESERLNVDLILLRFGEDLRNECDGLLYLDPFPSDVAGLDQDAPRQPVIIVGARGPEGGGNGRVSSVDIDNVAVAHLGVEHLARAGHKKILFVGGDEQLSNSRDRHNGFFTAAREYGIQASSLDVTLRGDGWRLDDEERQKLVGILTGRDAPTAVFAAGYYLALDVYAAARQAKLRIPDDLSVIAVDDPPSTEHLAPPLTTIRQPLIQLGQAAVTTLVEGVRRQEAKPATRTLAAELISRGSVAKR